MPPEGHAEEAWSLDMIVLRLWDFNEVGLPRKVSHVHNSLRDIRRGSSPASSFLLAM